LLIRKNLKQTTMHLTYLCTSIPDGSLMKCGTVHRTGYPSFFNWSGCF
jgi:hypothetical protein